MINLYYRVFLRTFALASTRMFLNLCLECVLLMFVLKPLFIKYMKLKYFVVACCGFFLASCSSQKSMTLLRDVTTDSAESINAQYKEAAEPNIVKGDQLLITVSALDQEAAAPFNLPALSYMTGTSTTMSTTPTLQYYIVDVEGNIAFPVLGTLHVEGMKKSELIAMMEEKLQKVLKDPIVTIRFLNYGVTVMGEVNRPGRYNSTNERMTILDALGLAGDMTPYGLRNNVLVTRETNGKLEFARIDLNSDSVFTSPYYYLQQNDVIYVSPNKVRAISSQNLSLYFSMISTLASTAAVVVSAVNVANANK